MRGSPILRTVIVLAFLVAAGAGLSMLGRGRPAPVEPPVPSALDSTTIATPFVLTLSHPASEILIESGGGPATPPTGSPTTGGVLNLDARNPVIFITINWQDPAETPRFAKLTLEPAGRSTLSRTFDSVGDLSDVWEPTFEE